MPPQSRFMPVSAPSGYSPQQQSAFNNILQQIPQQLQQTQNQSFQPIEAQIRKQFQEQTLPNISESLSAAGGFGGSAARNAQLQASNDLEGQIAAARNQYELGQQQLGQNRLQQLLQFGLGTQLNPTFMEPRQRSLGSQIGGSLLGGLARNALPILGAGIGGYFGGLPGAQLGAGIGGLNNKWIDFILGRSGSDTMDQEDALGMQAQVSAPNAASPEYLNNLGRNILGGF